MMDEKDSADLMQIKAKALRRWLSKGSGQFVSDLAWASLEFTKQFEDVGYRLTEKTTDNYIPGGNELVFEKPVNQDIIDSIYIKFDKYQSPRFTIFLGRWSVARADWVRRGYVCKGKADEALRYKLWGPSWWRFDKSNVFRKDVMYVKILENQMMKFLDEGSSQNNIFEMI